MMLQTDHTSRSAVPSQMHWTPGPAESSDVAARAAMRDARLRELTSERDPRTGARVVVGDSPAWQQVLRQALLAAPTGATVLLLGESGTGKEVAARFLHRASSRREGPFVALNCAALPEQLLEAELFGYERGAYTGAMQSKAGLIEQAAGGTLFLDEVGEMSLAAQAKFLRVLQEREFLRLGGTRVLRADVRVVAATNRNLARAIAAGRFREDLYYRLNVFSLQLPPLRDRREDILPLSEAFLGDIARSVPEAPSGLSRSARQALLAYHWPGNIRELRNTLERAAIVSAGDIITPEDLGLTVDQPLPMESAPVAELPATVPVVEAPAPPAGATLEYMERDMIDRALTAARFNKSKAAQSLGLTRHQLYIRMRKHGIE